MSEAAPPNEVFALATPADMLAKLTWEITQVRHQLNERPDRLLHRHAPSYVAFNCAVTVWHLADWAWEAASEELRTEICRRFGHKRDFDKFKQSITREHRVLRICQLIANGSKHMTLKAPDDTVRVATALKFIAPRAGRVRAGQPMGRYEYRLVVYDNDLERSAVEVFEEALRCWTSLLGDWGLIVTAHQRS